MRPASRFSLHPVTLVSAYQVVEKRHEEVKMPSANERKAEAYPVVR